LADAKRYAQLHNTTVSHLVRLYLLHISTQTGILKDAPITHRLSGILSEGVSVENYDQYLEKKYHQSGYPSFPQPPNK
jgi:hypothetical protein